MSDLPENKKRISVDILGGKYSVITDNDDSRVTQVASFVDNLIRDTKKTNPKMTPYTASVFACLNVCEELFKLRDEVDFLRQNKEDLELISEYKQKLVSALEEAESNEAKRMSMQIKYERLLIENGELKDLLEEYKDKFTSMRGEIEKSRRSINDLQNKLLENQIELVKARKNILDYSK